MMTTHSAIIGLRYISNYLSDAEQRELLDHVDQQLWLTDLKRRVQHYGYRYDYTKHRVDDSAYLGDLPAWITPLAQRLASDGIMAHQPDQLIINEYLAGQGISSHIDCVPCFGDTIVSISLGSGCVMQFSRGDQIIPVWLAAGSLVAMRDEARYKWKHAIPARKFDMLDGRKIERGRRVSLTFRTVINSSA